MSVAALCSGGDHKLTRYLHHLLRLVRHSQRHMQRLSQRLRRQHVGRIGGQSWIFSTGAAYGAGSLEINTGDGGNYA